MIKYRLSKYIEEYGVWDSLAVYDSIVLARNDLEGLVKEFGGAYLLEVEDGGKH